MQSSGPTSPTVFERAGANPYVHRLLERHGGRAPAEQLGALRELLSVMPERLVRMIVGADYSQASGRFVLRVASPDLAHVGNALAAGGRSEIIDTPTYDSALVKHGDFEILVQGMLTRDELSSPEYRHEQQLLQSLPDSDGGQKARALLVRVERGRLDPVTRLKIDDAGLCLLVDRRHDVGRVEHSIAVATEYYTPAIGTRVELPARRRAEIALQRFAWGAVMRLGVASLYSSPVVLIGGLTGAAAGLAAWWVPVLAIPMAVGGYVGTMVGAWAHDHVR